MNNDETFKDVKVAIFDYLGTIDAYQDKSKDDMLAMLGLGVDDAKKHDTEQILQTLRHLIILMRVPQTRKLLRVLLAQATLGNEDSDE